MRTLKLIIALLLFCNVIYGQSIDKNIVSTTFNSSSNILEICYSVEITNNENCDISYSVTDDLNSIVTSTSGWVIQSGSVNPSSLTGVANESGNVITWSGIISANGTNQLSYCVSFVPSDGFTIENYVFENTVNASFRGNCVTSTNLDTKVKYEFDKDNPPSISSCDADIICDRMVTTTFAGEETTTGTRIFPNTPVVIPGTYSEYKSESGECIIKMYYNPRRDNPERIGIKLDQTNCRHVDVHVDRLPGDPSKSQYQLNGGRWVEKDFSRSQTLSLIFPLSGEFELKIRTTEIVNGADVIRYFLVCEQYEFECKSCENDPKIDLENKPTCVGDVGVFLMNSQAIYGSVLVTDPSGNNLTLHDKFSISRDGNRAFVPFTMPGTYEVTFESCMADYGDCCIKESMEVYIEKCEPNNDSCKSNQLIINTGYDEAIGNTLLPSSLDPQWNMNLVPSNQSNVMFPHDAFVISKLNGWAKTQPNTMWISGQATASWGTNNGRSSTEDPYRFQRDFCTEKDTKLFVAFNVHADNNLILYIMDAAGNRTDLYDYATDGPGLNTTQNFDRMPETGSQTVTALINVPPGRHAIYADLHNESAVAMGWNLEGIIEGAYLINDKCCEPQETKCELKSEIDIKMENYCVDSSAEISVSSIGDGGYIYVDPPGSSAGTTFYQSVPDLSVPVTYSGFSTPGIYTICFVAYKMENGTVMCEDEMVCKEIEIIDVNPLLTINQIGTCPGSIAEITYGGGTSGKLYLNNVLVDSFNGNTRNFTLNLQNIGNYNIKAVIRSENKPFWCEKETIETIRVAEPNPTITTSLKCENEMSTIQVSGGIGGRFYIDNVLVQPVTGSNGTITYTFPSTGNYTLRYDSYELNGTNEICPGSVTKPIFIDKCPCKSIKVWSELSTPPICAGSNGIISFSGGSTGIITVTPQGGSVSTYPVSGSSGIQSHFFGQAGLYQIQYTGFAIDKECSNVYNYEVFVDECPPEKCCEGVDITMSRAGNTSFNSSAGLSVLSDEVSLQVNGMTAGIKEIRISMVDFEVDFLDDLCKDCKDLPISWGSLAIFSNNWELPPTTTGSIFTDYTYKESTLNVSGSGISSWQNLNLNLGLPTISEIGCCSASVKFCIKVTVIDENCIACEEYFCGEITYDEQGRGTMNFLETVSNFR